MKIEIVVIGESSKWVLDGPKIRIGNDPKCEVSLAAGKYPAVAGEHLALDAAEGAVKLAKGKRGGGEVYLNGHPAEAGAVIRSGDVLRLGAGGPELRLRLLEQEAEARPVEYEPTRVLYQPAANPHEPTHMVHEPTRVISGPAATAYSSAPPTAAGAAGRYSYSTEAGRGGTYASSASTASPRRPEGTGTQVSYGQLRGSESAARAPESDSLRLLEGKLKTMQNLLLANLAVLALLFAWTVVQGRELAQTHKELQELRAQAQSAVGQLTPSLDARLSVFEKRMDGMDQKINAAQDRMVKGMDAQAQLAEDRLVNRMNAEIPAMLDKFVAKKYAELTPKK
jgi:ribosomal 50S subunit-recycling heat shock protein